MKIVCISNLKPGQSGTIQALPEGKKAQTRLSEMGLRCGMSVTLKHKMPLKGPVIIEVGRTQIALGQGMADKIQVKIKQ